MRGRRQLKPKYTMTTAVALCNFRTQVVNPLQERLIRALKKNVDIRLTYPELSNKSDAGPLPRRVSKSFNKRPLSQLEKERICMSFYRFEMYCRLFGYSGLKRLFLRLIKALNAQYATWEISQLCCIHDFLAMESFQVSHVLHHSRLCAVKKGHKA